MNEEWLGSDSEPPSRGARHVRLPVLDSSFLVDAESSLVSIGSGFGAVAHELTQPADRPATSAPPTHLGRRRRAPHRTAVASAGRTNGQAHRLQVARAEQRAVKKTEARAVGRPGLGKTNGANGHMHGDGGDLANGAATSHANGNGMDHPSSNGTAKVVNRRNGHGATHGASSTGAPANGDGKANGNGKANANGKSNGNGHAASGLMERRRPQRVEALADDGIDAADLIVSDQTEAFRARFYPQATRAEWNDWKWQLRSRIRDLATLTRVFDLSADEREAVGRLGGHLPVGVTPYYASLMSLSNPGEPIRRTMIPISGEFTQTPGEADDPLAEDAYMPVEGLVHRYPDRVLFLVTNFCATYCRYCTRARMVGQTGEYHFNTKQYEKAIDYIAATPTIRDVLLSGGDPLTMGDDRLEWLLSRLRAIPHLEFLRIGTKVPAVLPQRITPAFCSMLRKFHPLWMSIHFMHPAEVTPEVKQACERLADAGIPLGSQTVLTKDVNDDVETMKRLMHGLLKIRVRPYYIYQCDPISGSSHFRTPVEKGLEIIEGLRGYTTGYAVPTFVIDAPGGGGKIPLFPDRVIGREGDFVLLRNHEGKTYRYPDPVGKN